MDTPRDWTFLCGGGGAASRRGLTSLRAFARDDEMMSPPLHERPVLLPNTFGELDGNEARPIDRPTDRQPQPPNRACLAGNKRSRPPDGP